MIVTAKFVCSGIVPQPGADVTGIYLYPVYHRDDPDHPNYAYWKATPSGQIHMNIANEKAVAMFEQGRVYTVTLEPEPDANS